MRINGRLLLNTAKKQARLAALREVRKMVASINVGPMAAYGSAGAAFLKQYTVNEIDAMIAKEEEEEK